jgi:hypothetical protein
MAFTFKIASAGGGVEPSPSVNGHLEAQLGGILDLHLQQLVHDVAQILDCGTV